MEWLHSILNTVVDWAILLFESMGVVVIVVSGIQGIGEYVTGNPLTRASTSTPGPIFSMSGARMNTASRGG